MALFVDNCGPPGAFWQHGRALLVFVPLGALLFGSILSCIKKQTSITYLEDCRFDVAVLLKALRRPYRSLRGRRVYLILKVFITFICVHACIYVYACCCAYEGQSTSWQELILPATIWVLGIKLRSASLAVSAFTHLAISLSRKQFFFFLIIKAVKVLHTKNF